MKLVADPNCKVCNGTGLYFDDYYYKPGKYPCEWCLKEDTSDWTQEEISKKEAYDSGRNT